MLMDEQNWPDWYETIKLTALTQDIWEYMNLEVAVPSPLLTKPKEPQYHHFKQGATMYSHLEPDQQRLYDHEFQMWEWKATWATTTIREYHLLNQHI